MTVEFFDNPEDMFEAIARNVEMAKYRATPEQNAITYGDYWMRNWEDFLICGYIHTKEEMDAAEVKLGASQEELEYEHRVYDESYRNGFRFGRAYSIVEPDGELGETHVSDMTKISKSEFEALKALGWSWVNIAALNAKISRMIAGL